MCGSGIFIGGYLQGWQDTRNNLKITREGRDLTAKRRGPSSSFGPWRRRSGGFDLQGFGDQGARGTSAGRRGWAGDPRRALTVGGDKAERPDFEEDGGGALVAGPVSVRRRCSRARLVTGSGVEGVARRLGSYGGDSLLRRLLVRRDGAAELAPKAAAAPALRGGAAGRGTRTPRGGAARARPRATRGRGGLAAPFIGARAGVAMAGGGGAGQGAGCPWSMGLARARLGRAGAGASGLGRALARPNPVG
jgi:hypothetical protein